MQAPAAGWNRKAQLSHMGEGDERLPQTDQDAVHGSPCDEGIERDNDYKPQTQDQGYDKICHLERHAGKNETRINCKIHGTRP